MAFLASRRARVAAISAAAILALVAAVGLAIPGLVNLWGTSEQDGMTRLTFTDAEGAARSLADFRGKTVLLNIWATWCVPCREEMPSLERLQASLGGADFQVVTVSVDQGGPDAIRSFFAELGLTQLPIFVADLASVRSRLGVIGLPTSILLDKDGREVLRITGPKEWDLPESVALIHASLKAPELPQPGEQAKP